MKFLITVAKKLDTFLVRKIIDKRKPDFIVPYNKNKIYMERWNIIPRNKIFNIFLHQFTEPDPDYTLHDHPWFCMSLILFSKYQEHTIKYGGVFHYTDHKIGDLIFMSPWHTHRICMVLGKVCRTLFITGPVIRTWGFHNSVLGWLDYKTYKERMSKFNGT